ncbi:MAG: hypothetical protein FJ276_11220 [Planctomycetes bacterium]|nr:hypothetical protein [Planctomycetota bacterium]
MMLTPAGILGPDGLIAARLPHYEPRSQQLEMAEAVAAALEGGHPFMDYQVPEAVIKLRQGFGRLIRSHRDHGIVVILDPRITTKPYGRVFLQSLPACTVIEETC